MNATSRPVLWFSSVFWLSITLFGVYFLAYMQKNKWINLGIDLVGGTYLTLEVKVEEAVRSELMYEMQNLVDTLKRQNIEPSSAPSVNKETRTGAVVFSNTLEAEKALAIAQKYQDVTVKREGNTVIFGITDQQFQKLKDETIEGNISILHNRLDAAGAGEITIVPQGEKNIVIELPNISDPEKYKNRIGKAALLELKPVYDIARTRQDLLDKHGGQEPEGTMIIPLKHQAGESEVFILVPDYAKVTGRQLKDATYELSQQDFFASQGKSPHTVKIEFKGDGIKKFYELTQDHEGEQIAIIIDNLAISAPSVQMPIENGVASITGDFTPDSAQELIAMLKSGAFTAPVEVTEERHIGPSLGQESIYRGLLSCGIGLGLLLLFSLLVYKIAGLFAFVVLLYNLLFILFGLALIPDATLTLPGIAGMILTVGMAIDSSILIYERIKEELAAGNSLARSVQAGFSDATSVILDANITTFIVGAVLYYFGSPAIQGFALTLMVGIVATLLTGLVLLRWLFNMLIEGFGIQRIAI